MTKQVSASQLHQSIRDLIGHDKTILFCDPKYAVVDDDGAAEFFFKISGEARKVLGGWTANVTDCDKFARLTQAIALVSHALSWPYKDDPAGLAISVTVYRSPKGLHAVNAIVTCDKNGKNRLRYFEPQTGDELNFTSGDEKNVSWMLF